MATPLRVGQKLQSDDGATYVVAASMGKGGYGAVFDGHRVASDGRRLKRVCIKVCDSRHDWHGEAFFGELLAGDDRAVELLDAFVMSTRSNGREVRRHVLVFEFMEEGTVHDSFQNGGTKAWTDARTIKELKRVLSLLARLHTAGITHRDLKPNNVYLRGGHFVVGDFGVSKLSLDGPGPANWEFAPGVAPLSLAEGERSLWAPADDVYQVGLLAYALGRQEWTFNDEVDAALLADLYWDDWFQAWVWHATGARSNRYRDAVEALQALAELPHVDLKPGTAPKSLSGERVVFTGGIAGVPRHEARELARAAGASVQTRVNNNRTVLVRGDQDYWKTTGWDEGIKLFAVRELKRRGHRVRVISPRQFLRLTGT
ncbi:MAG: serine/threonine protein kinase [Nocardioides sp.]|nr:serine/threonine protein kinase [Nocardioides sp.]|tara:strand:+ start:8367 stop:9482 length:1116 start_codon:yes stop_codon:yes gene_type:complete